MIWFASDNDIFITPRKIPDVFINYVRAVKSDESITVHQIVPQLCEEKPYPLTGQVLLSNQIIEAVKDLISHECILFPYYFTKSLFYLKEILNNNSNIMSSPFCLEGGAELLNLKDVFRQIALGNNIPCALGGVSTSLIELQIIITHYIDITDL